MDFVSDVEIVFAESLWDRTATCCRSRLYCLVKSAERRGKWVCEGKGGAKKEKRASFSDLPVLVFNPQIVKKYVIVGIGQRLFFVGGRVYLVDVRVTACFSTIEEVLLSRRGCHCRLP